MSEHPELPELPAAKEAAKEKIKSRDAEFIMAWPEVALRVTIAVELLLAVLVAASLLWDAPLEGLADPMQTPNPAKAPWYFLGLQELLHYFPPVVGGVLIPSAVIAALLALPYFDINLRAEGFWMANPQRKKRWLGVVVIALAAFLAWFEVWAVLIPTLLIAAVMFYAAGQRWLYGKTLSFWIMSWFLTVTIVLTVIGTFFRGAGWAWVWPWGAA